MPDGRVYGLQPVCEPPATVDVANGVYAEDESEPTAVGPEAAPHQLQRTMMLPATNVVPTFEPKPST